MLKPYGATYRGTIGLQHIRNASYTTFQLLKFSKKFTLKFLSILSKSYKELRLCSSYSG